MPSRQGAEIRRSNPVRFSTKYQDDETDMLYYGYRYYNPVNGMWNSRDPMQESGGLNLYELVSNDAIRNVDPLGLSGNPVAPAPYFFGYQTVKASKAGKCGDFTDWDIVWNLSSPAKEGGWVIRHITELHDIKDSSGNPVIVPNYDFWEVLGYIPKTGLGTGLMPDDTWSRGDARSPLRGLGTQGRVFITAVATFYDSGFRNFPETFIPGDFKGPWGSATHSFFAPPWQSKLLPVKRALTISWDCSCGVAEDSILSYE